MKLTPEQEVIQQQLQEEAQRQATAQGAAGSQQASNIDFAGGAMEVLDIGLDLLTSAGSATLEGACTVASCVGDVAVGTAEVAGAIVGGTIEVIGSILGALAD